MPGIQEIPRYVELSGAEEPNFWEYQNTTRTFQMLSDVVEYILIRIAT